MPQHDAATEQSVRRPHDVCHSRALGGTPHREGRLPAAGRGLGPVQHKAAEGAFVFALLQERVPHRPQLQ